MYTVFGAEEMIRDRERAWRELMHAQRLEKEVRGARTEVAQQTDSGRTFLMRTMLRKGRRGLHRRSLRLGPLFIAW